MRKCAIGLFGFLSILVITTFGFYWTMMLLYGKGDLWNPYRIVSEGSVRFTMYRLVLYSLVMGPAAVFLPCRLVSLFSNGRRLVGWTSLRALSNLSAAVILILLGLFLMAEQPWEYIQWGGSSGETTQLASDEENAYPELPLKEEDPFAWSVLDLEGNEVPMERFRGKAVFINQWATWCKFCIVEFSNIQRLYEATKSNDDIAFIILSSEKADVVKKWLEANDYDLPFYLAGEDLPDRFKSRALPSTFFVGPDGRIAYKHRGACAWDGEHTQTFLKNLSH